jgi:hypothetical protein
MNIDIRKRFVAVVAAALGTVGSRNAAASDVPEPAAATHGQAPATHHGSVFVDPLGFVFFGPTFGAELGIGKVSALVYGRWFNEGVLAQGLFLKASDRFDFSYGVGLRGRYYAWGGLAGPHVGVGAEYLSTRVDDPANLIATNSRYLVPQVEGGYRFALGAFYAGGAAALGYAFELSSSVDNLPGGTNAGTYQVVSESKFYGSASLELGVYF